MPTDGADAAAGPQLGEQETWIRAHGAPRFPEPYNGLRLPNLSEAMQRILVYFDEGAGKADLWHKGAGGGSAVLFRRHDRRVVVVGQGALADATRALLPLSGWALYPVDPHTPLTAVRARLSSRAFNMLSREGFVALEEVSAVPESGLLCVRNLGARTITEIHTLSATRRPDDVVHGVPLTALQVAELQNLLAMLVEHALPAARDELARRTHAFLAGVLDPER